MVKVECLVERFLRPHQPARLQHREMLHHRRQGHVERPGEFAHRGGTLAQALDHDPAGRVGQRLEGEIERGG
jgi:hypothetical protein